MITSISPNFIFKINQNQHTFMVSTNVHDFENMKVNHESKPSRSSSGLADFYTHSLVINTPGLTLIECISYSFSEQCVSFCAST